MGALEEVKNARPVHSNSSVLKTFNKNQLKDQRKRMNLTRESHSTGLLRSLKELN